MWFTNTLTIKLLQDKTGKRLLLLGGGHSQVEVLRQFARRPVNGTEVVLVSRDPHSLYSGMLPGYIAGHYRYDECLIELVPLARAANATFIQNDVQQIDADNRVVRCSDGRELGFDIVSINSGATSATNAITGSDSHAVTVKPVNSFGESWIKLLNAIKSATRPLDIAVIGGGAGGVELLLAIIYRYRRTCEENPRCIHSHTFHLITGTAELLPDHHARVRKKFARIVTERGVQLHLHRKVTKITASGLQCEDGSEFAMDHIILATQAAAPAWIKNSGITTDQSGFILVNDYLQSLSHPHVFAAGDISTSANHPRPKSGVNAVRQGPVLAENLRRYLNGQSLIIFRPQKKFLALISCGDKYAVASRGAWAAEGKWLWILKKWIDRRHVRKYSF